MTSKCFKGIEKHPFGMMMVGRKYSVGNAYRYGFNGKENDNEAKSDGNQIDYGMRIYDPRVVRFLSVDPLTKSFSMLTPYQYASNRPIDGIDLDGMEHLSFHKAMYRMQYKTITSDIELGGGTAQKVSSSFSVVNTVYENIPAAIQDAKTRSYKFVNGGPVTTEGRDYDSQKDGAWIFDKSKYYGNGSPTFNGMPPGSAPEPSDATKPVGGHFGDEVMSGASALAKVGVGAAAIKEGIEIGQNVSNMKVWDALFVESGLRAGFYNSTNTVDRYLQVNPKTGTNYFGNSLSGESDRVDLINFLTDGFLKTGATDALKGKENRETRRAQYGKQLQVAWHGLQVMQAQGIQIRKETVDAVNNLLNSYKADGGGAEYDNINKYTTTPKR